MYPDELIAELFGQEVLRYVNRKNIGGASNERGHTYENFFAAYQLAQLAKEVIEAGTQISLSSQVKAFVDDLIVAYEDEARVKHYQLKNSSSVSWGSGLRSIADDFEKQYHLNEALSKISELHLVVSDPALQQNLAAAIPSTISSCSQVIHFPYDHSLAKVIANEPRFKQALTYLSAFEHPSSDKIECVAGVLVGAWASCEKASIPLIEVLKTAQQYQPSFIRSFNSLEIQLDTDVAKILDSIQGFTYKLSKGFLHWEFQGGLERGTLPYSCETEKFKRFQELIKQNSPTSFEELEVFLL